jgi:hypothetical protein
LFEELVTEEAQRGLFVVGELLHRGSVTRVPPARGQPRPSTLLQGQSDPRTVSRMLTVPSDRCASRPSASSLSARLSAAQVPASRRRPVRIEQSPCATWGARRQRSTSSLGPVRAWPPSRITGASLVGEAFDSSLFEVIDPAEAPPPPAFVCTLFAHRASSSPWTYGPLVSVLLR